MLFMVQMRHDGAHCPGYHRELLPVWVQGLEKREELAQQTGVKIIGLYSALPEHLEIAIVEADSGGQVAAFVSQLIPSEQAEITMTALTPVEQVVAMARQMMG